ncbi:MAG: ABC transporter permease [Stappiaceae bacterium]
MAGFIAIWWIAATFADPLVLPSPSKTMSALWTEAQSGALFVHMGATLLRVVCAFFVALFIGAAMGIFLGLNPAANRVFDPWVTLFLNIPALVIIVLAYIWIGLNEAAAIGAVAVNKIPNVIVTLREGARSLSPELDEMARVYRFSKKQMLFDVILPQLQPFFAAASRSGISLIWKIVLVVELLGRSNGVGFQINLHFQLFDVATILAYTFSFVAVMLVIEMLVLQPWEGRATRWRAVHA